MKKTKAFGYVRVSGRGQMDGDGPQRQRSAIEKFCAANNLDTAGIFTDGGVSGTVEAMDRPQFTEMIGYIEREVVASEAVDIIVVERLDRLARDLMVQEMLLAECRKRAIKVYATDQGLIDQASSDIDPTRTLIRQVIGALSQWEKSSLVLKLRAARDRKRAATGRCEGPLPYGHKPGEADIIKYVTSAHYAGSSFADIANLLRLEGFPAPKRDGVWAAHSIKHLLVKNGVITPPKNVPGRTGRIRREFSQEITIGNRPANS